MIQENEIITLIIGFGGLVFIFVKYTDLQKIPALKLLIISYAFLFAGWIITITEAFFLNTIQNIIEHLLYLISLSILFFWCHKVIPLNRE